MALDYVAARSLLDTEFSVIEGAIVAGSTLPPFHDEELGNNCDTIFASATLAYREALLGCVIARLQDRDVDLSKPYVNHGDGAFNGRSLDAAAVNPFLQEHRIPCTAGPYLSKFRRSVRFDSSLQTGTRDGPACDSFLACLNSVQSLESEDELLEVLRRLLGMFAVARESSRVPINKIQRFSLDQYDQLIDLLLKVKSGGRFPLFIVVAGLTAIRAATGAEWEIQWQEINVADNPSGAVGDVTVTDQEGAIVLAAEVTERTVDQERLVSTFNSKIGPNAMPDYLFFITKRPPPEAQSQAFRYFAQGHEINFLEIAHWAHNTLGTVGRGGRSVFNSTMVELMEDVRVPQAVKAGWNQCVDQMLA